jgi:hypothetical protein
MSDHTPKTQDTPPAASQNDAIDQSRRKLTGTALGVSAIFTLASRPVFAQCLSPSAAMSGNLSRPGDLPVCTGLSPAQWVAQANTTAQPNNPDNGFPGGNVKFHDASGFASGSRADWGNARLYEVMGGHATPGQGGFLGTPGAGNSAGSAANPISADPISMEFAATLLNIRDSRVPATVLTENGLIGMWNEWMGAGVFTPMAGATCRGGSRQRRCKSGTAPIATDG